MVQIKRFIAFFLAAAATVEVVAQPIRGGTAMRVAHGEKIPAQSV